MVGTLVELAEVKDESRFRELIAGLASRHIKYGVKSHHASIMGQVKQYMPAACSLQPARLRLHLPILSVGLCKVYHTYMQLFV
jgi:hypothetical protein